MAKPTSNFGYTPNGLSVSFTDSSSGVPTEWSWDFGYAAGSPLTQQTSTSQNPTHTFPAAGVYKVTLITQNSDGISDAYSFTLVVNTENSLTFTIAEMVACDTPAGLAVDTKCFNHSMQTWMMYLKDLVNPVVSTADVFNEVKWDPLVRILISKLIIYDIILDAAKSSAISWHVAAQQLKANNTTTSSTMQVADYTYDWGGGLLTTGQSVIINTLILNGINKGPSSSLTTNQAILDWFNAFGIGNFYFDGTVLTIKATNNFLSTISFTKTLTSSPLATEGHNGAFTLGDVRVVPITQLYSITGENLGFSAPGPIKYIETGPSKGEFYDSSSFWSTFFKSIPGTAATGGSGGIFENVVKDICGWASRLHIRLPMCPALSSVSVPLMVGRRSTSCKTDISTLLDEWRCN